MTCRKPERAVRDRLRTTPVEELQALNRQLRREIPDAQSFHSAVRRELKRRRQKGRADAGR